MSQPQPGRYILVVRIFGVELLELAARPPALAEVLVDQGSFVPERPEQLLGAALLPAQGAGQGLPRCVRKSEPAQGPGLVQQQRGVDRALVLDALGQPHDLPADVFVARAGGEQQFREGQLHHHVVGFKPLQPFQAGNRILPARLTLVDLHQAQQHAAQIRAHMRGHLSSVMGRLMVAEMPYLEK